MHAYSPACRAPPHARLAHLAITYPRSPHAMHHANTPNVESTNPHAKLATCARQLLTYLAPTRTHFSKHACIFSRVPRATACTPCSPCHYVPALPTCNAPRQHSKCRIDQSPCQTCHLRAPTFDILGANSHTFLKTCMHILPRAARHRMHALLTLPLRTRAPHMQCTTPTLQMSNRPIPMPNLPLARANF